MTTYNLTCKWQLDSNVRTTGLKNPINTHISTFSFWINPTCPYWITPLCLCAALLESCITSHVISHEVHLCLVAKKGPPTKRKRIFISLCLASPSAAWSSVNFDHSPKRLKTVEWENHTVRPLLIHEFFTKKKWWSENCTHCLNPPFVTLIKVMVCVAG